MEKFAKKTAIAIAFFLSGCASPPITGYIGRVDHPYEKQFYASYEKVVSSIVYVLKQQGWAMDSEANPSIYEQDDRYDNNGYQNLLIMTSIRKKALTSMHLNVFIHSIGNTCDVEIRYEAQTPLIKKFISVRNDQVVQGIFDAVEKEVSGSNG